MSTGYEGPQMFVSREIAVHLPNDARTCQPIATPLTQTCSRKVLGDMADIYERADASCKASFGFTLRRNFAAFNALSA